jgi:hypothetical protein
MPKRLTYLLAATVLCAFSANGMAAKQIMICVVDANLQNNPLYFKLPNTATRLRCEFSANNKRPNLRELYREGWELIDVVPVDPRASNQKPVSPVLYLERDVPGNEQEEQAQPAKPSRKPDSGWPFNL